MALYDNTHPNQPPVYFVRMNMKVLGTHPKFSNRLISVIIRKSRSLLKSIDIYVGTTSIPSGKIDTIGLLFIHTEGSDKLLGTLSNVPCLGTLSNVPCVEAYPHTVALYDDQTFRDFTSSSFIQANWSRQLLLRGSQGERGHLRSKCVFELSKFFYDTMQLSSVTENLESRDAIISKDLGCFNPGRGFMGRSLISFNLYKRHIPWDRGKMVERKRKKCMGLPSRKEHINCPWVFFTGALVLHDCHKKMENQHVQNVQDGEWIPNRYQWLLFIHMEGSDKILGTLNYVPCVEAYPHIMVLYDNITQEQNQPPVDMITCFWAQKCASVGVKVTR
jgi:hypothetical protein